MTTTKKFLCALLCVMLVLSLCACAPSDNGKDDNKPTSPKTLDIVLVGGQSNAVGFSPWDAYDKIYSSVKYFGYGEGTSALDSVFWQDVHNGLGVNGNCFGPEMGMAEVYSQAYKDSDRDIGFVKYAWGGKTIYDHFLSPTSVAQGIGNTGVAKQYSDEEDVANCALGFWNTLKTIRRAVAKAKQAGYEQVNILAMCWMQGENDATTPASVPVYDKLLANFIADIRFYLEDDDLPFVIGQIKTPDDVAGQAEVIEMQKKVVAADSRCTLVNTSDLSMKHDDGWHYDYQSMLTLGRRFAEAAQALTK